MKEKIHGIISLFLFSGTAVISFIGINKFSTKFAIEYLLIVIISFLIIIYSYCTKCKCHEYNCLHIIPGFIVKILPKRKTGKYLFWDYIGVIIPMVLIIFIPQYWLIKNMILFLIFWTLLIIALVEIINIVCKACINDNCLLCKNRSINKNN